MTFPHWGSLSVPLSIARGQPTVKRTKLVTNEINVQIWEGISCGAEWP